MDESQIVLYALILGNCAAYILVIIRARMLWIHRIPKAKNVEQAFLILERRLLRTFPDLPAGFTWREVIERLRSFGIEVDWSEVEKTLKKYEAFRYGGLQYSDVNVKSILRLASVLPQGAKFVSGSEKKSS